MRSLILTTIAGLFMCAACQGKSSAPGKPPPAPPREVDVVVVQPQEARVTGEYLGSLLSRASLTVLPQVAGYVRKIHVKPGQTVAASAPIVEVDSREESAALVSASAQAESAKASLALAEQSRARVEALHREGLATAQELDQRRADVAAAQAAVRAAGAQVSQRQVAVGNHVVRAAVPGVVGDVQVRLGDYVTATTRLTTIAGEQGGLELTVGVPATRARGLAKDVPVELLGEDGTVLLTSPAFFVSPEADPRTQLVAVKAIFKEDIGLRPSELVRARVVYSVGTALQVPALAVVRQSGSAFVFVVVEREGKLAVERRLVQLGALGPKGYIVDKGLSPGDRVAVSSIQMLRDGAAVTIKPAAPAGAPPAAPTKAAKVP
jgi:RND family efflux transporter MFP subunit